MYTLLIKRMNISLVYLGSPLFLPLLDGAGHALERPELQERESEVHGRPRGRRHLPPSPESAAGQKRNIANHT